MIVFPISLFCPGIIRAAVAIRRIGERRPPPPPLSNRLDALLRNDRANALVGAFRPLCPLPGLDLPNLGHGVVNLIEFSANRGRWVGRG
jgi:hypothetical protein